MGIGEGLAVARLDTDEIFGEMGLCTGEPRSATVRSRGECVLLEVNRADLLPMLEEDPSVLDQLSRIVASRRSELERLSSQEAEERHNSILQRMRDLFGLDGEDPS
jgi:CRP-like cAMP-binding protein